MKRTLRHHEEGLGTVEKLLIVALFAFGAAAGMRLLSTGSNDKSAEQGESIATTNSVIGATGEAPTSLPTASPILDTATELPISDALIPSTTATIPEAGDIPSTTARIPPGGDIPRGATAPVRPGGPEVAIAEPLASDGFPGVTAAAILGEGFEDPFARDSVFLPGAEYEVAEADLGIVSDAVALSAAATPTTTEAAAPGSSYVPGEPGARLHLPPPSEVPLPDWSVEPTDLSLPSGETALIRPEPVEDAYCVGGGGAYACLPEPSNAEREGARLDSAVATIQDGADYQFTRLHGGPGVEVNPEGGVTGIAFADLSPEAQVEASFQMNALGLVLTNAGFALPQEYDGVVVGGNMGVDAFGFNADGQVVSWDAMSADTPRPFGDRDMGQLRTDLECALYGTASSCSTDGEERLAALNAIAGGEPFIDQKLFPGAADDFLRGGLNSLISMGATVVSPTTYEELWAAEQAAAEANGGWGWYMGAAVVNTPDTAMTMLHGILIDLPNQVWDACTTSAGDCGGQVGPLIAEALVTKGAGGAMVRTGTDLPSIPARRIDEPDVVPVARRSGDDAIIAAGAIDPNGVYAGVIDLRTGEIRVRNTSSTPDIERGLFPRSRTHAIIADDFPADADLLGFTVFPLADGRVVVRYRSASLNEERRGGMSPDLTAIEDRTPINDGVAALTGRDVIDSYESPYRMHQDALIRGTWNEQWDNLDPDLHRFIDEDMDLGDHAAIPDDMLANGSSEALEAYARDRGDISIYTSQDGTTHIIRGTPPDDAVSVVVAARPQCFVAGTLVETKVGLRPIQDVQPGDLVLSRDDKTGEIGYKPVARTFITPDKPIFDLDLLEADGDEQEFLVTPEHPFWTVEGWAAVEELEEGQLVWARDGWAEVRSVVDTGRRETVYNFEVEDFHTYYVGEAGVWVHNVCIWTGTQAMRHVRKHAQHARETAMRMGLPRPSSLDDVKLFLEDVVESGDQRIGTWGDIGQVQMSRMGDAVVIRRMDGSYVTNLDISKGGNIVQRWEEATPP